MCVCVCVSKIHRSEIHVILCVIWMNVCVKGSKCQDFFSLRSFFIHIRRNNKNE